MRRRRGYEDRGYSQWGEYVPVAVRRAKALKKVAQLEKSGHPVDPVVIEGRSITSTFWGKAWCHNLESYSDYSNRLPRGRTYVRNGSVVDLQIGKGSLSALVSGSRVYTVDIHVSAVQDTLWTSICADCSQSIDSLVELLQGHLSKGVMERICQQRTGLFPTPGEIRFHCSCPDSAYMCKHVAAVLYGVGSRLDHRPELLFVLRNVDPTLLIGQAVDSGISDTDLRVGDDVVLGDSGIAELFGIDMETTTAIRETTVVSDWTVGKTGKRKPAAAKATGRKPVGGLPVTKTSAAPEEDRPTSLPKKRGHPKKVPPPVRLTDEEKVLRFVRQHLAITVPDCRELLGIDIASARLFLKDLVQQGILRDDGRLRGPRYLLPE